MKKIILFTLLFFNLSIVFSQDSWKEYTEKNFALKYPDAWTNGNNNGMILFSSPKDNSNDSFQENVNLMKQDLSSSPMSLEEYTELTRKQVVDNLGNSAIISLKNLIIDRFPAKEFIYNMNYQGKQLKLKQYWFIKNKVAYLFTYTALISTFDRYEKNATTTIKSFKFIK